jgi:carbon monoxide dehydrogenase subunit G
MEISGTLRTNCTPDEFLATLSDAQALNGLLPEGASVEETAPGRFAVSIARAIGPLKLTLPGLATLSPGETAQDRRLQVKAAHVIGGKVEFDLYFNIVPADAGTRVTYSGKLDATGLAGRIVRDHKGRVNTMVKGGMARLKHLAETRAQKAGPAAPQA